MRPSVVRAALTVRGVGPLPARLLALLADYANDAGRAWPSREQLVEEVDSSRSRVNAALRELVALGWIERESGGHRGRTIVWRLHPERWDSTRCPQPGDNPTERVPESDPYPEKGVQIRAERGPDSDPRTLMNAHSLPPTPLPTHRGVRSLLRGEGYTEEQIEALIAAAIRDPDTRSVGRLAVPEYRAQLVDAAREESARAARAEEVAASLAELAAAPGGREAIDTARRVLPPDAPAGLVLAEARREHTDTHLTHHPIPDTE